MSRSERPAKPAVTACALAAGLSVVCAGSVAAAPVDITSLVNANLSTYANGSLYPKGPSAITIGGVGFDLAPYPGGGLGAIQTNANSFTINVGQPQITTVYVLINSAWGASGVTVGSLVFTDSAGDVYTYSLVEGTNIRDHANGGFNNVASAIYGTANFGGGQVRLDAYQIVLPEAFANNTLQTITFSGLYGSCCNGAPFLAAVTAYNSSPRVAHDFNGDGMSDILWRDSAGNVAMWLMNGNAILASNSFGAVPTNYSIIGQRDFTGAGEADILWRDTGGGLAAWFMNGLQVSWSAALATVPPNWAVYGTGDLNGDGVGDLLWRDSNTGTVAVWFMNGGQVSSTTSFGVVPTTWTIVGDDNKGDIFWRDNSGNLAIWQVNGSQLVASAMLGNVPLNWAIAGLGDFTGDGNTDILWRDGNSGAVAIWFFIETQIQSTASLPAVPGNWTISQTGDYNGDGMADILWRDSNSGAVAIWFMNGSTIASSTSLGNVGISWTIQSVNAQ